MGMMMSLGEAFGGQAGMSAGNTSPGVGGPVGHPKMTGVAAAFGKAGGGQGAGLAGLFNIAAKANTTGETGKTLNL